MISASGRLTCLEKMMPLLEPYNFETVLCDSTAMHLPTSLIANKGIEIIKERYGLPSGTGPNNGVSMWWKEAVALGGKDAYKAVEVATEAFCSLGADWIMIGPAKAAPRILPAVAIAQCNLAALILDDLRELPENQNHPFYKLFPEVAQQFKNILAGVKKERRWTVK